MSRRSQQVLAVIVFIVLPGLAWIADGCFGFPIARTILGDAIDYIESSVFGR